MLAFRCLILDIRSDRVSVAGRSNYNFPVFSSQRALRPLNMALLLSFFLIFWIRVYFSSFIKQVFIRQSLHALGQQALLPSTLLMGGHPDLVANFVFPHLWDGKRLLTILKGPQ